VYEIKKGIPRPEPEPLQGRPKKYPFADMNFGDCFDELPGEGETPNSCAERLRNAANSWRLRHKVQCTFSIQQVEDDQTGVKIVRCWKIEKIKVPPRKPKAPT
jgi:hypothetical protein